jgi:hypothetical protein
MSRSQILWANLLAAIDAAELMAEESTGKLEREGWQQQASWLRELRARRIAMGREPDDEVNAPADMCCCNDWPRPPDYEPEPQFADGCPLHPRPELTGAEKLTL